MRRWVAVVGATRNPGVRAPGLPFGPAPATPPRPAKSDIRYPKRTSPQGKSKIENRKSKIEWHASDEAGTARLAAALAAALRPGDVVALNGDLGAGKTRLVREIARALGIIDEEVNSPTFVLIHEYEGRVPLYHVDAYRLRDSDEFLSIGGDEVLAGDRACLIEWADRIADVLPRDQLRIEITATGETTRRFALSATGARSASLLGDVRRSLGE